MVVAGHSTSSASLLELDPELLGAVPEEEHEAARRATQCPILTLERGPTTVLEELSGRPGLSGFYLADGVLLREIVLADVVVPELFGTGELICPEVAPEGLVGAGAVMTCVEPATLLVLGPSFARAAGHWPGVLAAVERRKSLQRQRVATFGAISHLPKVADRVLISLWQLAATWGRVAADGTVIPFPLTHETIGRFVRAQRSTVSLAIAELEDAGLLTRRADRTWLLPAGTETALQERLRPPDDVTSMSLRERVSRTHRDAPAAHSNGDGGDFFGRSE